MDLLLLLKLIKILKKIIYSVLCFFVPFNYDVNYKNLLRLAQRNCKEPNIMKN
jgi:hypothetical protein